MIGENSAEDKSKLTEEENERYQNQVVVLTKMAEGATSAKNARPYRIDELALALGKDEHDVQRSLFILEGHKYVSPHPIGDFTSRIWSVTELGVKALANQNVVHMTSFL